MERVPRILSLDELTRVTFYQWIALMQCPVKGMIGALKLDCALPAQIPTRGTLVGRFHHRAMELAVTVGNSAELDEQIEKEIQSVQAIVNRWPQLRRAGSVSGWDEINKSAALAMRMVSARGLDGRAVTRRVEKELRSTGGLLVGRPDYFEVTADRVLLKEYKSGAIREPNGLPVPAHLEQLRFYAVLIFDNFEVARIIARLESLTGDSYEMVVERQDANEFSAHVARTISDINLSIRLGRTLSELARPSAASCSFCEARVVCTAFKREQDHIELDGEQFLVEGLVTQLVRNGVGTVTDVTVADEYRKSTVTITVPSLDATDLILHTRAVFLNLRLHGAALAWGHTSRVFSRA